MAGSDDISQLNARLDRIEALLGRIPGGGVADPAPDDFWGQFFPRFPRWPRFPFPQPGDPAPVDLSRLTRAQLELAKETVKSERIRLDAVEKLIDSQISSLR